MGEKPVIRIDDVLQVGPASRHQREALAEKNYFDWFLECDEAFKKYNYPCILATLAEGIDLYPKWVEHIKKNIHRYQIELHGWDHINYSRLNKKLLYERLSRAIDKIEKTFDTKVTTWFLPWGRKGKNQYGQEVCNELGIIYDVPTYKMHPKAWNYNRKRGVIKPHINIHYWCEEEIEQIENIIKLIGGK